MHSTVRGSQNFFSRLRNLRDENGELVFNSVDFRLECKRPACKEHPEKCTHIFADMPSHLSAHKAKRVQALMSGEEQLMLQETRGIETDPNDPQFPLVFLDEVFDKKKRYFNFKDNHPKEIHVLVDPNGGGSSNYAVASFVRCDDKIVLVGVENKEAKDPLEHCAIIVAHIKKLLAREEFKKHVVVLGVESNLGMEAYQHQRYIVDANLQKQVCVLHESNQAGLTEKSVGIHTSAASKANNSFLTRFNFHNHRYAIAKEVTCISGDVSKVLQQLYDQLAVYSKITEPPKRLGGKPVTIFTGKHVGKQDDLAQVYLMFIQSDEKFNSPMGIERYRDYHQLTETFSK